VAMLIAWSAANAADREFDQIVKAIESHYGVKPTHIPLMGLGNLFLKTAHPAGVSGFKVAVFENLDDRRGDRGNLDWVLSSIDSNLRSIVQVRSQPSGEATYIYMGNPGKSTLMLIASIEDREATVMEVKLDTEALLRFLRDPDHIGDTLGIHQRQDP
jgi:hypothetical protein